MKSLEREKEVLPIHVLFFLLEDLEEKPTHD